jgi:CPA1 family monovalent cation:H+ antiporter
VFGAIVFGLIQGYIFHKLIKPIDEYKIEIFLSLAIVYGGYILADEFGFSGPIAIVVFGLYTGNIIRHKSMSMKTREHLTNFWMLIDEFLNAVVFTLLGFEVLSIQFSHLYFLLGGFAIIIGLIARFGSVAIPISLFPGLLEVAKHRTIAVLTWGGLRGALSIALAVSLSEDLPHRSLIIFCTYSIVAFSILVQALTMERFVLKRL